MDQGVTASGKIPRNWVRMESGANVESSQGKTMTTKTPVGVDDAIVLLLGAPTTSPSLKDRIEGITRLEKLVFLLERETDIGELLTEPTGFEANKFGPFSAKIYQEIEALAAYKLIEDFAEMSSSPDDTWEIEEVVGTRQADPYATRNLKLTPKGRKYYESLIDDLPASTEEMLEEFKARFANLPLRQLIRYVYKTKSYESFLTESVIKDQILA